MSSTPQSNIRNKGSRIPFCRMLKHARRPICSAHHIKVTSSNGQRLPCRRRNEDWLIFTLPRDTRTLYIEQAHVTDTPLRLKEIVLFIENKESRIPLTGAASLPLYLNLPAIPHWAGNALCLRPEQDFPRLSTPK